MEFVELTPKEVSDFIINDPVLICLGFSDSELVYMYEHKEYKLHKDSKYIGIKKDDDIIGILKWEYFTEHCISIHPYIASTFQGKGLSKEIGNFISEHLMKNTDVKKAVAFIMEPCEAAIRAAKGFGFKLEGHITKCTYWRQKLTGIYIYGLELDKDEVNE